MSSASHQDRPDNSREVGARAADPEAKAGRRPYEKPRLDVLGDVRDVTLGVSPGSGDSNDPVNFRF